MLLQSSSLHPHVSLSSSCSFSSPLPSNSHIISPQFSEFQLRNGLISCSISPRQKANGGVFVDYERRAMLNWIAIYRGISLMANPELGSASMLNRWDNEGKKITKSNLFRVIRELRKYKRFNLALEVYEWMINHGFRTSSSDMAIQLDLIAKVHGIAKAEDYILKLPDKQKDQRIYGSLLNVYGRAKMRERAETLMNTMQDKGFATSALPYNVMMTLYMNLKEYDKVITTISEMMERKIPLDMYSYNIWLSCCGSQGSVKKMEQVFEQMQHDQSVSASWTTFSTMATKYIKLGMFDKAANCLKEVETRIASRERIPYHYLVSMYGSLGNTEEVHRVWSLYKSSFTTIPNLGFHAVISALVRSNDFKGAKKIYDEWLTVKSSYDPRIGNLIMSWYVKEGLFDKADSFFNHMLEAGGNPNSSTWEFLAAIRIRQKRFSEALSCLREAGSVDGVGNWRPNPVNMRMLLEQCEEDADDKEALMGLLREKGWDADKAYSSLIGIHIEPIGSVNGNESLPKEGKAEYEDGVETLMEQFPG